MNIDRGLFVAQRVSAMVLAPLVLIHLGLILVAVSNGLTGEEILGRTRGNTAWAGFYLLFVIAVSVHGPIGLRHVLREWTGLSKRAITTVVWVIAVIFLLIGLRAVIAVY